MKDLTGTRCYIGGIKHTVLMDDGRSVLVDCTHVDRRKEWKAFERGGTKRWVSRGTVLISGHPAPPYFWLGADAEAVGALKEMG